MCAKYVTSSLEMTARSYSALLAASMNACPGLPFNILRIRPEYPNFEGQGEAVAKSLSAP